MMACTLHPTLLTSIKTSLEFIITLTSPRPTRTSIRLTQTGPLGAKKNMEDDPLLKSKAAAAPPPPPSVTQQPATNISGGKGWWRWGRGQAKRAYEEIIDDEEAFWTELWRVSSSKMG